MPLAMVISCQDTVNWLNLPFQSLALHEAAQIPLRLSMTSIYFNRLLQNLNRVG
jgi:hypothetical protein